MIEIFRNYYYTEIFNLFKKELEKISKEFNINYEELEKNYLSDFKKYIKK